MEKKFGKLLYLLIKYEQILNIASCFWENFVSNLKKMKAYKNFDEIRGEVQKTTEKILRKF